MRRFCSTIPAILTALLLAACSSVPQQSAHHRSRHGTSYGTPPHLPHFIDHSTGHEEIPIEAMGLVGVPYRWGGNTPESGFDCSGLVQYVVARAASVKLPRTTADMSRYGESVRPEEIAAGDLVFFNTDGQPHSHVGIYVGKLRFVDAPSSGGTVRLDSLNNPYWASHFDGIRRVVMATRTPPSPGFPAWRQDNRASHEQDGRKAQPSGKSAEPTGQSPSLPASGSDDDDPIARFAHGDD